LEKVEDEGVAGEELRELAPVELGAWLRAPDAELSGMTMAADIVSIRLGRFVEIQRRSWSLV
jgi:hypothetical protein